MVYSVSLILQLLLVDSYHRINFSLKLLEMALARVYTFLSALVGA